MKIQNGTSSLHKRYYKRLEQKRQCRTILCALVIVLTTYVTYGSLLRKDFPYVNYDDPMNFKHNVHVHRLSYENIRWAWTEGTRIGVYEPCANMIKMMIFSTCRVADSEISETDFPAHCIHRSSVVLHVLNAILSFILSLHFVRFEYALTTVMYFMIHSQRVEVVAWASGISYLICCTFVLLSVLTHLRSHFCTTWQYYFIWRTLSVLTFFAATMSKSVAVSVVAIYIGYDLLQALSSSSSSSSSFATSIAKTLKQNLVIISVSCVSAYIAIQSSGVPADLSETRAASLMMLSQRVLVASGVLTSYLTHQFVPAFLKPHLQCARYPLPEQVTFEEFSIPFVFIMLLSVLSILTILLVWKKKIFFISKEFAMIWLVYVAMLLPTLGVLSGVHVSTFGADRYTYVPTVVILVPALASFLSFLCYSVSRRTRGIMLVVAAIIIASNALDTVKSIEAWSSSVDLWHVSIKNCPKDVAAYSQLGVELLGHEGRRVEAIEFLEKAVDMKPDFISALLNLGVALEFEGRLKEASEMHLRATEVNPMNPVAWFNAGNVLAILSSEIDDSSRRVDVVHKSANALSRAIGLRTNDVGAISRLGLLLCEHESRDGKSLQVTLPSLGWKNAKWRTILETAVVLDPNYSAHNHNLGFCHRNMKNYKDAERETRLAIQKDHFYRPSHVMLLDILKQTKNGRRRIDVALRDAISAFPTDKVYFTSIARSPPSSN